MEISFKLYICAQKILKNYEKNSKLKKIVDMDYY